MSYINFPTPTPVFPALPSQGWAVHKKPILASRVSIAATGREVQLAAAAFPRFAFTLTYGWLREQTQNQVVDPEFGGLMELQQISGLFLLCRGAYGEFYYTDPDDSSRLNQFIGWGDGTTTSFRVYYTWGTGPFSPSLTIPVGGISTLDAVYFNGTPVGGTTLNSTLTRLVFSSPPPPGTAITADFHFYYRCRFLEDTLAFSQFAKNRWELKEIRFESVKE